jgi:putative ABC transport system ATP-binding protein
MSDAPIANAGPLISAQNLVKTYPDGNVQALRDVSFNVEKAEYVIIMGPSGCGKSTLLNVLGTLDKPDSGDVLVNGESLVHHPDTNRYRRQQIGFVFQSFLLLPTLRAVENVQVPMFGTEHSPAERSKLARELLIEVGLEHRVNHVPNKLSVGERQRVAIARALANNPPLLLADEPTGNLDSKSSRDILDLFDRLHRDRQLTLVVVTHSNQVAERGTRILRMQDGSLLADDRQERKPAN